MRIVIDTNVVVSAVLLPSSVSRQAFDAALLRGQLLLSKDTLSELSEVLCRPKFNKYVLETKRLEFFAVLVRSAEIVDITHANCIVSGDNDLLVLNPFRNIAIMSPSIFLERVDLITK